MRANPILVTDSGSELETKNKKLEKKKKKKAAPLSSVAADGLVRGTPSNKAEGRMSPNNSGRPTPRRRGRRILPPHPRLISWASAPHRQFPGVYARVSRAYDWIRGEVIYQQSSLSMCCSWQD